MLSVDVELLRLSIDALIAVCGLIGYNDAFTCLDVLHNRQHSLGEHIPLTFSPSSKSFVATLRPFNAEVV